MSRASAMPISTEAPGALRRDLAACGLAGPWVGLDAASKIPSAAGAYALCLELASTLRLALPRLGDPVLTAGWYLYAGSARGPGGLGARIGRHFRRDKPVHWHIDRLTATARLAALPVPDGQECALIARLIASPAFVVPVPGFGSSDCGRCASHLLAWRPIKADRPSARPSTRPAA
ncbi:MAG: GIY-YIG nuclease family protein [Methyloligellaceae bacterium]